MLFVLRSEARTQADGGQEAVRDEMVDGRLQRLPSNLLHVALRPGLPGQQLRALHLQFRVHQRSAGSCIRPCRKRILILDYRIFADK